MEFVISLLFFTDWQGNSYDSILIIVKYVTKMVHYESVKVTINDPRLAEVIINVVVWHHGLLDFIIGDYGAIFTSKF